MFTQVFVFARRYCGASFPTLAISVTAIVIFAIASCPTLLAQTHSMHARARPGRVGIGPQVRPRFSVTRTGVIGTRPLGHQSLMVRRFPFRHHRHFNFFLANACFNDPFFDPFLCRRFFLGNSLFLSQPLLLPYPIYADASYAEAEESVSIEEQRGADLSGSIDRLTDELERLREAQESAKYIQPTPSQNQQAVEAKPPARANGASV